MKKLIALLSILVLASCSKEDPIKYFSCTGDDDYEENYTIIIDTSKKEFRWITYGDWVSIPYEENVTQLISKKVFADWEKTIEFQKNNINEMYAKGETEYDADSEFWKALLFAEAYYDDFKEYRIYTFDKITGITTEDYFEENETMSYTHQCEATEPAMK